MVQFNPEDIDAQDIQIKTNSVLTFDHMDGTYVDGGRWTYNMKYQGQRAQDQLGQTKRILREHKRWLTLGECTMMESHMLKAVHSLLSGFVLETNQAQIRQRQPNIRVDVDLGQYHI